MSLCALITGRHLGILFLFVVQISHRPVCIKINLVAALHRCNQIKSRRLCPLYCPFHATFPFFMCHFIGCNHKTQLLGLKKSSARAKWRRKDLTIKTVHVTFAIFLYYKVVMQDVYQLCRPFYGISKHEYSNIYRYASLVLVNFLVRLIVISCKNLFKKFSCKNYIR